MKKKACYNLLVVIVTLSIFLVACSNTNSSSNSIDSTTLPSTSNNSGVAPNESSPLLGVWKSSIEMSDYLESASDEAASFFDWSNLSFTVILELNADKTFIWKYDEESIKSLLNNMRTVYEKGTPKYLDYVIQQKGLNMTREEALQELGMTMDELVDGMMQEVEDSMVIESFEGTYSIEGGRLHLLHDVEGDEVFTYQCSGEVLTIDYEDIESFEGKDYLFPMTLLKSDVQ